MTGFNQQGPLGNFGNNRPNADNLYYKLLTGLYNGTEAFVKVLASLLVLDTTTPATRVNGQIWFADPYLNYKVGGTEYQLVNSVNVYDLIGLMVTGNTENGIDVTYDNTNKKFDFDIDDFTLTINGAVTGNNTITDLSNTTITTSINFNLDDISAGSTNVHLTTSLKTNYDAAYSLKGVLDALNGIIKCDGAGSYSAITDNSTNWNSAYTHVSSNGSDHTYIDQDVTTSGTPTFSTVQAAHKSSDGTSGATVSHSWTDGDGNTHNVTVKDGIITAWTKT